MSWLRRSESPAIDLNFATLKTLEKFSITAIRS
jgi:hypothetical protein